MCETISIKKEMSLELRRDKSKQSSQSPVKISREPSKQGGQNEKMDLSKLEMAV